jgi:hypothetical protein
MKLVSFIRDVNSLLEHEAPENTNGGDSIKFYIQ